MLTFLSEFNVLHSMDFGGTAFCADYNLIVVNGEKLNFNRLLLIFLVLVLKRFPENRRHPNLQFTCLSFLRLTGIKQLQRNMLNR